MLILSTVTTREGLYNSYLKMSPSEKRVLGRHTKNYKKLVAFGNNEKDSLFELGIIALFANFETFQYELLCELLGKYPEAYNKDITVEVQELNRFATIKQARDFYVDSYAIEKTFNLVKWEQYVRESFGILLFPESKDFQYFRLLNETRNIFMHSGGKFSSRFHKEIEKIFPGEKFDVTLRAKLKQDKNKLFGHTYLLIQDVIKGRGMQEGSKV